MDINVIDIVWLASASKTFSKTIEPSSSVRNVMNEDF